MNATSLYVSASQLVFKLGFDDNFDETVQGLNIQIPQLRLLLGCAVCCSLINDPYIARNKMCNHNVCRECIVGRKALQPPCPNCSDLRGFSTYDENGVISRLVQCYKGLCEHISASRVFPFLSSVPMKQEIDEQPTIVLWNMSVQAIVLEGAQSDDFSVFASDISSNSTLDALEAASSSAARRLKEYRRARNPEMVYSDDDDDDVERSNVSTIASEIIIENHVDEMQSSMNFANHLNGAASRTVFESSAGQSSSEIMIQNQLNETSSESDVPNHVDEVSSQNSAQNYLGELSSVNNLQNHSAELIQSVYESHIEDQRSSIYQNNYESELQNQMENHSLEEAHYEQNGHMETMNELPNYENINGGDYYENGTYGGAMANGFQQIDRDEHDEEVDQENVTPNDNRITNIYENINGFDRPESPFEERLDEGLDEPISPPSN